MKIKRIISLICVLAMVLGICSFAYGCGGDNSQSTPTVNPPLELPLTNEYGIADQSKLFGICYLLEERNYWGSPFTSEDLAVDFQLIENLGAKTVRHWMHFVQLMENKDTMRADACKTMHYELKQCTDRGIVNIGMNHHNFNNGVSSVGKIKRSLIKNSEYINWLDDYYTSWYNLVKEFPEVEYWEIDNELNNPDFMFDAYTKNWFTSQEMVDIATDMLYYGTRAIHDANPKAKSVMGGLTEPLSMGNSNLENSHPSNVWFLQRIYDNIASGEYGYFYSTESDDVASINPDDYFDVVNYHPYVWSHELDEDFFVAESNKFYDVVLANEHKHKVVIISEVGTTELSRGETLQAEHVRRMFHAISERMPYVETVDIFKIFDKANQSHDGSASDHGYSRYGLFHDPNPAREYFKINENDPWKESTEKCIPGSPKKLAYVFQEMAGGHGSLTLLQDYYKEEN